jgi:predicted transcriptional regulator
MVMDYLITFAKEIDHGAGAYFFEAFLAFLAGGQAGGKAKGAAGGMGESDFVKKDGKKGSAKYLAKGTDVEQAAKSFLRDDPVEYIVAYKVDSSGKAVSDPDKLYALNISNFFVEKLEEFDENGQANFKISNFEKKEIETLKVSRNQSISMKKYVAQTGIGTLYLAKLDDEDLKPYRENIVAYADTLEDVSQRAFEAFEALSKQLNVAREKSKIYATGLKDKRKQKQTGTDALDAMTAAKDGQEKLINIFENPSPAVTQESKLSDLDKLILEVLKENT